MTNNHTATSSAESTNEVDILDHYQRYKQLTNILTNPNSLINIAGYGYRPSYYITY